MYVPEGIDKILFTKEQIHLRTRELGEQLANDYAGKVPLFLCVLRGASVFFTDLIRSCEMPLTIDFIRTKSYVGTESSGKVEVDMAETESFEGKDLIIVEDICDTGRSLTAVCNAIREMNPKSLKTVCLCDKPSRRVVDFQPDYTGFVIDDLFVVGYGFDVDEHFRNLPYIGVFKT